MSALYRAMTLDESTDLLNMSYRLRYHSFCLERPLFSKDRYPAELESDSFDQASVHVGVLNAQNELVGTARVVPPNAAGLPLLRYCHLFPYETTLANQSNTVVELSRVCINHRWRRAADATIAPRDARVAKGWTPSWGDAGNESTDAFATLIKGMYHVTKRLRGTHWIIAVEKGLRRRISRYGLPFRPAGPQADYHGPVVPYVMSLADLDEVILSGDYEVLDDFPVGLEPEYWPSSQVSLISSSPEVMVS